MFNNIYAHMHTLLHFKSSATSVYIILQYVYIIIYSIIKVCAIYEL